MIEVSINKQARLSEHFTLGELTKTRVNIENVPNEAQVENLKRLCRWLEQLRRRWNNLYGEGNDPIIINSGYRSEAVNKAVGGVKADWLRCRHPCGGLRTTAAIRHHPARHQ